MYNELVFFPHKLSNSTDKL